jgi:hypothetical protein
MGRHQRGVHIEHHHLRQIGAGDLGRRHARDSTRGGGSAPVLSRPASAPPGWPHPTPATPSAPTRLDRTARFDGEEPQCRRSPRPPGGQHHSDVHPDLAAVMTRSEPRRANAVDRLSVRTGPVGE